MSAPNGKNVGRPASETSITPHGAGHDMSHWTGVSLDGTWDVVEGGALSGSPDIALENLLKGSGATVVREGGKVLPPRARL